MNRPIANIFLMVTLIPSGKSVAMAHTVDSVLEELAEVSAKLKSSERLIKATIHVRLDRRNVAPNGDEGARTSTEGKLTFVVGNGQYRVEDGTTYLWNSQYLAAAGPATHGGKDMVLQSITPQRDGNEQLKAQATGLKHDTWDPHVYAAWTVDGVFVWDLLKDADTTVRDVSQVTHEGRPCVAIDWQRSWKVAQYDFKDSSGRIIMDPAQMWALQFYEYTRETESQDQGLTRVDRTTCRLATEAVHGAESLYWCRKVNREIDSRLKDRSDGHIKFVSVVDLVSIEVLPYDDEVFRLTSLGIPEPDLDLLRTTASRLGPLGLVIGVVILLAAATYVIRRRRS